MPMSTASTDSGFFGCSSQKKHGEYGYAGGVVSKSPLSMTDEEDMSVSSCGASTTSSFVSAESSRTSSASPPQILSRFQHVGPFEMPFRKQRSRGRRSNRRSRSIIVSDAKSIDGVSTTSSSSCCPSIAGSSSGNSHFILQAGNREQLAVRVYLYFKTLLMAVNRQKTICEQIGLIMRDVDARWGNAGTGGGRNKKYVDPRGCLAPVYSDGAGGDGKLLVKPAKFPACWAVPQPSVYYSLLANDIREYLRFLERETPHIQFQSASKLVTPITSHDEAIAAIQVMTSIAQQAQHPPQHIHYSMGEITPCAISSPGNKIMVGQKVQQDGNRRDSQRRGSTVSNGEADVTAKTKLELVGSSSTPKIIQPPEPSRHNSVASSIGDSSRGGSGDEKSAEVVIGESSSSSSAVVATADAAAATATEAITAEIPAVSKPRLSSSSSGGSGDSTENCSVSSAEDVTISMAPASARCGKNPPPIPDEIVSTQGEYKVSKMDVLSEKIWHYHNKVSQTDEMLSRKLHLRDRLYTAISPVFPMCGLYVVGSSLNGFGNNSSDMDLCLMITNKELDQKNDAVVVLNLILTTLQYEKFVTHQKLILAKVPILRIKFADPYGDITVDLNANNSVAIKNTHLLCYYSSYDWRVRPLVSVVKEWAKRKGINDANKSSFTSYSLVLMVIHFLQCGASPKVLPNLQKMYPERFSNKCDVRLLNVTMPLTDPIGSFEPDEGREAATLGELLIGFLEYYAKKFDYDHDAISIRQGKRMERAILATRQKGGNGPEVGPSPSVSASSLNSQATSSLPHSSSFPVYNRWTSQWRCVCIEEPFTNSNTAHSIYDEMVFAQIKMAFVEAHEILHETNDLDTLMACQPINVATAHPGASVYTVNYEGERPPAPQFPLTSPLTVIRPQAYCYPQISPPKSGHHRNGAGGAGMNIGNHRNSHHQYNIRRSFTHNPTRMSNSNENQKVIRDGSKGGVTTKECLANVKDLKSMKDECEIMEKLGISDSKSDVSMAKAAQ